MSCYPVPLRFFVDFFEQLKISFCSKGLSDYEFTDFTLPSQSQHSIASQSQADNGYGKYEAPSQLIEEIDENEDNLTKARGWPKF